MWLCFSYVTCCVPSFPSSVERGEHRRKRWVLVGQGHRPPALGPLRHVTTPPPIGVSMATCPRWEILVRGREITSDGGGRKSGREEEGEGDVWSPKGSFNEAGKYQVRGDGARKETWTPKRILESALMSVCLSVCFNPLQCLEQWSHLLPRDGICCVVLRA